MSRRDRAELEELTRQVTLARRLLWTTSFAYPETKRALAEIDALLAPRDPSLAIPKPLSFWNRRAYRRLGK